MRRLPVLGRPAGLALLAGLLLLAAPRPAGAERGVDEEVAAPAAAARTGSRRDPPVSREAIVAAIDRGVAYLVASQNADGSWGGPAPTLTVDIYAPGPGSHDAYRAATSALALRALVEGGGSRPGVAEAIEKGTVWLLAHHDARRDTVDVLYNTWAHAYALGAFAALLDQDPEPARERALREAAREAVDLLARFEYVDGGWGYYDFTHHTARPGTGATSFTTATVLVAMKQAAEQGVTIPPNLVRDGLRLIRILRFPRGSFGYSFSHRFYPHGGINKIKGSLARTPACYLALDLWGEDVPATLMVKALDELEEHGHFLLIARKYPRPHETWYANSGYFAFYGYHYAARLLAHIPAEARRRHQARIAAHLVPLQEEDGSFWDYQLYRYHKPYGTAYVLMALVRCLSEDGEPVTGEAEPGA